MSGWKIHQRLRYFNDKGKIYWLENAWSSKAGLHEYNNLDEIKNEIKLAHIAGTFGNKSSYNNLSFGDLDVEKQVPGETLQELVNTIKWH